MASLNGQPDELILKAVEFLPLTDLQRCRSVNKRWNGLIMDTASLWTIVDRVPAKNLAAILSRSGTLPVSLVLDCDVEGEHEHVYNTVRPHLGRIWKLHIVVNCQGWYDTGNAPLLALLNNPAPMLRDLKLDSGCVACVIDEPLFQGAAPLLRRIHMDGFEIFAAQPAFSGVTHFTGLAGYEGTYSGLLDGAFKHIRAFTTRFPSVRHLHLTDLTCLQAFVLGPDSAFPRNLETLRLEYRPNTAFKHPQLEFSALYYANWDRLRILSITNSPPGLVSLIVNEIHDAASLALDRGPEGAYLELTTRSSRVLWFAMLPSNDLAFILNKAAHLTSSLEHILLGPRALEAFHPSVISALFTVAPNVRVLTVALPLEPSLVPARDVATVLHCWNWTSPEPPHHTLSVPRLEELRITASPGALDAPRIRSSTVSWFIVDVLLRQEIPLLSLWCVDMMPCAWPARWTVKREHMTPFELSPQ